MKKLPQRRLPDGMFPAPEAGSRFDFDPVPLQWVAEPGVERYRAVIERIGGGGVAEVETDRNAVRFRQPFGPGRYRWNVYADDAETGWRDFEVLPGARSFVCPEAAAILAARPPRHPRHLYFAEDLPELRERHADALAVIRRNVAQALERPLMEYPDFYHAEGRCDYRTAFDESRLYLDRDMVACALAYLFLGDRRAGERARDLLLRVCSWNPLGPASGDGEWGDEIGLSITRCGPAVFDWTWDLYDDRQRRWVGATLAQHAAIIWQRIRRVDYFAHPGASHIGRLSGYLGEAALVLADFMPPGTAEEYLAYAIDVYGSHFPHYGGRDGGWAEGVFYASSYTKWYLPFFLAVERLTGFSFMRKPFYRHLTHFFLHFAPPGQESHPFGDGHWPTGIEWPGFQAQNPFGVYADRFGPELARDFSRRANAALDHYELHLLDAIPPLRRDAAPEEAGEAANGWCCRDTGFVSFRTDIARPERSLAVLARCSRYAASSHQHADQGNFALLAGNQSLLVPSGSFGYLFGERHHREWTRQTIAQNCVLIDGAGQPRDDADAFGTILDFRDDGNVASTVFDLARCYAGLTEYRRELRFDRAGGVLTVTDTIAAPQPVTADFRLHSYAKPEQTAEGVAVVRERGRAVIAVACDAGEPVYSMTDRFIGPDGGEELAPAGRRPMPDEYHLNWRCPRAARLVITARIRAELRQE